jgi:hypothetical protein
MEYCAHGDLGSLIAKTKSEGKKFSEKVLFFIMC